MKNASAQILKIGFCLLLMVSISAVLAQRNNTNSLEDSQKELFLQRIETVMQKHPERFSAMKNEQLDQFREKQLELFSKKNEIRGNIRKGILQSEPARHLRLKNKDASGAVQSWPVYQAQMPDNYTHASSTPEADSLALVALYNATNGDNWYSKNNWLTGPVSTWYGVDVSIFTGDVTGLWLYGNNLVGTIPAETFDLLSLYYLDLSGNQLYGNLPSALGNLTNLGYLDLSYNQLTGSIPVEIGDLTWLYYLYLNDNLLDGTLPVELTYLTLYQLNISWNNFYGEIPYDLCWSIINQFDCSGNYFDWQSCPAISCMVGNCIYISDGWQKNGFDLLNDCWVLPYVNIWTDLGYSCSAPFTYSFNAVDAYNYDYIYWYTSGDGYFDDPYTTNPTYYLGNQDILDGYAGISVEAGKCGNYIAWDYFTIYISEVLADAGPDDNVQVGIPYPITNAAVSGHDRLFWESSGTGYFDNNQLLSPTYFPGVDDINAGTVSLCVSAWIGDCTVTDCFELSFTAIGNPDIDVDMFSISAALEPGNSIAYQITVSNLGTENLVYEISMNSSETLKTADTNRIETVIRNNIAERKSNLTPSSGTNAKNNAVIEQQLLSADEIIKKRNSTRSSATPKIACVIDSYGAHVTQWFWDNINIIYPDILIDYSTLAIPDITYTDLVNSNADVLIIDDAWHPAQVYGEFTIDEINAISQYVSEGKGLIVTSGTLNDYLVPNHSNLAPLLGLDPDAFYEWNNGTAYVGGSYTDYQVLNADHPVFNKLYNPFVPGFPASSVPNTRNWEDAIVEAEILAISSNHEAVITSYKNRVFISYLLSVEPQTNDYSLMYNAIRYCATQPSWLTATPLSGVIAPDFPESRDSQNIIVFVNAGDLPLGEYHANISISSNDPDESPFEIPVALTIAEGGIPEIRYLENTTTFAGNTCYAATQTIYVGPSFVVEGSAVMSLEAGNNIVMLPGTHFKEGTTVHARIVTGGDYCITPLMTDIGNTSVETSEKNQSGLLRKQSAVSNPLLVALYPNPTQNFFVLEFINSVGSEQIDITIMNLLGEQVYSVSITDQQRCEFDLTSYPAGLYLIRIQQGRKFSYGKMIRQ